MKTDIFRPLSKSEIFTNARTRFYYKDDEKIWLDTLICDKPIFNPFKAEKVSPGKSSHPVSITSENESTSDADTADRASRRARNKVFELCLCNEDLRYFATFTPDSAKIDRKNYDVIIKKLNSWLDYRVRNMGLKYIIVAEYHSNKAIHFHALMNDVLPKVDSGTVIIPERDKPVKIATALRLHPNRDEWQTVYNVPSWKLGFSTLMDCEQGTAKHTREATCGYISKYITKGGKCGGRYYLSGGDLKRPEAVYYNADFGSSAVDDATQLKEFEICGTSFIKTKPKRYGDGGQSS